MEYKKRIADQILAEKLEASGAVLIEGPKYCGKTTLAKQQAGSVLSMSDPETIHQNLALARTKITRLLAGDTPRLIDDAESLNGKVYHYRDKNNLECDAVVHLRNGSYGLIEIKLGGADLINDGAESLKTLSDKIDTTKMKKPSFLMVLTGIGDYAYKRPKDGVLVVPIGCLRD